MSRKVVVALPDELADTLLDSIVEGHFPVESVLSEGGRPEVRGEPILRPQGAQ